MACLSDLDAYCIKAFSTKSLSECQSLMNTVLKEMAFRRLMSDLPKVSICMVVLRHLRYRIILLLHDVSASATTFLLHYTKFYSYCLSPESQASSSKRPFLCSSQCTESMDPFVHNSQYLLSSGMEELPVATRRTFVPYQTQSDDDFEHCSDQRTMRIENVSDQLNFESKHNDSDQCTMSIENTISCADQCTMSIENTDCNTMGLHCQDVPDLITGQNEYVISSSLFGDFDDYFHQCCCVQLNIPSMFHIECVDFKRLLGPFEPLSVKGHYSEMIEVNRPQKLIGSKRSRRIFSFDECYSIGSTRIPAGSSNSTCDFVDWRELLSWASSGGRSSTIYS